MNGEEIRSGDESTWCFEFRTHLRETEKETKKIQRVQTASDVEATNALFEQAMPFIPIWDPQRIEIEFEGFKRSWGSKRLIPGTKESLRRLVQSNLEKTTQEFGFQFFTVDVMPQLGCGQVMAWSDGNGASACLWRSESGLYLFGNFFFTET